MHYFNIHSLPNPESSLALLMVMKTHERGSPDFFVSVSMS